MKKLIKAIDIADVLTAFGILTIGFGLWLYRPWVSLFVVGIIAFSLGIFLSIPKTKRKHK